MQETSQKLKSFMILGFFADSAGKFPDHLPSSVQHILDESKTSPP